MLPTAAPSAAAQSVAPTAPAGGLPPLTDAEVAGFPPFMQEAHRRGYQWAVIAWRRAAAQEHSWFDAPKADKVVDLWPKWFRLTEDRFYNQPFYLSFWQEVVVRLLVGWKRPIEITNPRTRRTEHVWVRLFDRLDLWIPRKNGKTEFLAALAHLFWRLEKVFKAQGFCFAKDEKQGRLLLDKMKTMASLSGHLSGCDQLSAALFYKPTLSIFQLLPGTPDGKHGRSPTVIVGDEMHEWKTRELLTTLRQGTGARLQPIQLLASTAGLKSNHVGYELYEESVAILEGILDMPGTLVVLFRAEPDDDIYSAATWKKANPSLGVTPTLDFMRKEAALAKMRPRAESEFKRYHLNIWVDKETTWLPLKKWDACTDDPSSWRTFEERLKDRRFRLGIDLSHSRDITALVRWYEPDASLGETKHIIVPSLFLPRATFEKRADSDIRLPWRVWEKSGAIEIIEGEIIDQSVIEHRIRGWHDAGLIDGIAYDPYLAAKLVGDLQNYGMEADQFVIVRQGPPTLTAPSQKVEDLVFAGLLDHGGHPVLRWMVGNVVIRFGENALFCISKSKSLENIDGIAAAINACCLTLGTQETEPSAPWEDPNYRMQA